ncbi:Ig-like domain repeat protein [Streptomyces sp. NBC_00841]|uniref:YncE family protein n=1 Tax=unclassified Streptomyces TaxID=2593676 RepID=UPI0022519294|nr:MULTISPECIES: Ig-like domain repeat protein [unclassified Streptomyces]MCX4533822.1 Ig-like domain repeat protein [Streptomyces sp. NBC_01669]WSA00786.1 Ig-like domain repeat protein [Streptomyces sp. NBC_00841]
MRTRSISTATALAVLFSSAVLSVAAAGSASAASAAVASPGGIVADGALKRVFVGDRSAGKILAADYTGALVDSVSGVSGVSGLAVSDDGATLYAAAEGSHEIVALDAATLDVKARYAVATDTGPRHVAFAGGKVWFTYGDQWDGDLGSVDPAVDPTSGTDVVTLGQFPQPYPGIWGPALLDTDPSAPGLLAVGQTGISTDSMAVVDVSGTTPQLTAWYSGDYTLNQGIGDIDLVPGAPEVLVNGMQRDAYADGKFTAAGAYPSGQRADIAADGLVAQVGGAKVAVYRPGATQPLRTYATGTAGTADLTWAPDSSRIFALVGTSGGYTLKALTDPTLNVPSLTVNAPSTATRGKQLTVTGKLSATVPLPSGAKLQVTRTDLESPSGKALPAVTVKADGSYTFTDTPPAGGTVTYKVAYAGDAGHTAVSASDKVSVPRTKPTLTLNKNGNVYNYGADVSFTAHLGSTYKNRTVEIWANPFGGDKPNKLLKTGKVNSSGNISATVDMTRDTDVTAVFKGDARTAPRTVKSTAYARVKVSTAVSKHYKTAKIGSTSYYWFHKSTDPLLTTTMTYYKGRKQRFDLQVYSGGKWYSADSEYFPIGTNGKSVVSLEAPGQSGIRARMRSVYVNGSSGDTVNTTTYGSWKYLYFSK